MYVWRKPCVNIRLSTQVCLYCWQSIIRMKIRTCTVAIEKEIRRDIPSVEKNGSTSHIDISLHSSFINSSGMTKLGICKSWCAPISLKLTWSWSRAPKKTFYVRPIQDDVKGCAPLGWKRKVPGYLWRRKLFFGLWISYMKVLVILVRIRIYKNPILSCLNYW